MLRIFDSWYAVARAMLAARAGSPRWTEMAVIRAAFSACSWVSSTVSPSTSAVQPLGRRSGPTPRSTSTPTPTKTSTPAMPTATSLPSRVSRVGADLVAARGTCLPMRQSLACRAALRAMPSPFHGTASIAPLTELRRNSTLLAPDSSSALTTLPPSAGSVTLVPAVT